VITDATTTFSIDETKHVGSDSLSDWWHRFWDLRED
jgi:hypothetical protein